MEPLLSAKKYSESMSFSNRNHLLEVVRNRHVNGIITFILIAGALYLTTVAALQRDILHPFTTSDSSPSPPASLLGATVISLLFLLLASLALGWLFGLARIPPLFGALITGVACKNIPFLTEIIVVEPRCEYIIRLLALACIIIRWGVGLDTNELKKRPILPLTVGVITPIAEAAVIALAAHFLFDMRLSIAIICGFLMAAVSPAVTVPVMLELRQKGRGTANGIPTAVLASSSVDNLFCIGAFSAAVSLVFSDSEPLQAILLSLLQIVIGVIGGHFLGWIFWWFPLSSSATSSRILLLASASAAAVVGCSVISWATTGIIGSIIFCSFAASRWRMEQNSNVREIEQSFGSVWNLVCLPLLFSLIGLKLNFSELSGSAVWIALALIALGAVARLISTFFISKFSFSTKEALFLALSMLPKATVQAALAPGLLVFTQQFPLLTEDLRQAVTSCILVILVTAPLGQLLLIMMGSVLLQKDSSSGTETPTISIETPESDISTRGYTSKIVIGIDERV